MKARNIMPLSKVQQMPQVGETVVIFFYVFHRRIRIRLVAGQRQTDKGLFKNSLELWKKLATGIMKSILSKSIWLSAKKGKIPDALELICLNFSIVSSPDVRTKCNTGLICSTSFAWLSTSKRTTPASVSLFKLQEIQQSPMKQL